MFWALPTGLTCLGEKLPEKMKEYRRFVEEGLVKKIEDPFQKLVAQSILGSERFVEGIIPNCAFGINRFCCFAHS
ncbi:hypothetical protein ACFL27_21010 [candidate division CSSED10-310 bacterium]|uniref:Uncharacterized protein n=1 Tax=candidate division CSSED10-310 bacterium TaxID=2855610 RepID=A0ABV6Z2K5_UNCC1